MTPISQLKKLRLTEAQGSSRLGGVCQDSGQILVTGNNRWRFGASKNSSIRAVIVLQKSQAYQ